MMSFILALLWAVVGVACLFWIWLFRHERGWAVIFMDLGLLITTSGAFTLVYLYTRWP